MSAETAAPSAFRLIGLAARARSGKDTVAKRLALHGFAQYAVADPIKRGAQVLFGLTDAQTWDDDLKDVVIPELGKSPWQIYQLLGFEFGRQMIAEDIWIRRATSVLAARRQEFQSGRPIAGLVITDIRREDEAAFVRSEGGVVWHIIRPDAPAVNAHSTESGIRQLPGDVVLMNDSTLPVLFERVETLVRDGYQEWRVSGWK